MKKNISINLFGTLYAIDEDAYTLLERYLSSMKSYFARQQGGEEIADDIEHRVAELLWQRKQEGMEAVNIETIKDIIAKIGNPDEIENPDESIGEKATHETTDQSFAHSTQTEAESGFHYNQTEEHSESILDRMKARIKGRRLYRDSQNKLLGGVLSGLAQYFDTGDPLWWRLGTVALFLLLWYMEVPFALPIFYGLLWIIIPEALLPEDRLRMKGQEVNPQTLNAQILMDSTSATAQQNSPQPSSGNTILKVLFGAFLGLLLLPLGILILFLFFFIILATSVIGGFVKHILPFDVFHDNMQGVPEFIQTNSTNIWFLILFGALALGIPLYLIIRKLFMHTGHMSGRNKVVVLIIWIISLIMLILTLFNNGARFMDFMNNYHRTHLNVYYSSESEDSIETDTIVVSDPDSAIDSLAACPPNKHGIYKNGHRVVPNQHRVVRVEPTQGADSTAQSKDSL